MLNDKSRWLAPSHGPALFRGSWIVIQAYTDDGQTGLFLPPPLKVVQIDGQIQKKEVNHKNRTEAERSGVTKNDSQLAAAPKVRSLGTGPEATQRSSAIASQPTGGVAGTTVVMPTQGWSVVRSRDRETSGNGCGTLLFPSKEGNPMRSLCNFQQSPLAQADADLMVEIIHGPHQDSYPVAGWAVSKVRMALADVFNVPPGAEALVDGHPVMGDAILQAGGTLEFIRPSGSKALGELLAPRQLKERWGITDDEYRQLLGEGLPIDPVTGRHPELAVDEWWREQLRQGRLGGIASSPSIPTESKTKQWFHTASEEPPTNYPAGPLVGTKKSLICGIHHDGRNVPSRLEAQGRQGVIWVRKVHTRRYEVWFRTEKEFTIARERAETKTK